jgi:hypothetical protein
VMQITIHIHDYHLIDRDADESREAIERDAGELLMFYSLQTIKNAIADAADEDRGPFGSFPIWNANETEVIGRLEVKR